MRGSPLLRAFLAFVIILLAGIPLWRLTGAGTVAAPIVSADSTPVEAQPIALELTFTRPPTSVKILHLGKEVWSATAPEHEAEAQLQVPYPPEGIELVFSVGWPEGEPAAMRVRLQDPSGETQERTIWGQAETTEVLSFP